MAKKKSVDKNVSAKAKASANEAKSGDKVVIEYTGSFDDGNVFDSSERHGKPLEFELGKSMVIPGFEKAIIGMKVGEEKKVRLEACDAYGDHRPELVKEVPKEHMPKEQEPKPGMMLVIGLPNGMQAPAVIKSVGDKTVTIDINHPLAGKPLNFNLKLVGIN